MAAKTWLRKNTAKPQSQTLIFLCSASAFLGGVAVFAGLLARSRRSVSRTKRELRKLQEEVEVLRQSSQNRSDSKYKGPRPGPVAPSSCVIDASRLKIALSPNGNKRRDPFDTRPRELYLSWDDYFMSIAFLSSMRSKDPNKQVGACITGQDRVILGIGYNGFPRGCCDHKLPWAKTSADGSPLGTKYPYVCHAEMNAIMNKNAASIKGATIYVTMFPCNNCAKLMIQAGIREVVYFEDKRTDRSAVSAPNQTGGARPDPAYEASHRLLGHAKVKLRQHIPRYPVFIDF